MMNHANGENKAEKLAYITLPDEPGAPPRYEVYPPPLTASSPLLYQNVDGGKPTKDQCIAHLKLLEAFHQLRQDVATTDGLFGIWDKFVPPESSEQEQRETLVRICEKRWAVYVAKAALRFETWWRTSIQPGSPMLAPHSVEQGGPGDLDTLGDEVLKFSQDNLPPLGEIQNV